MRRLPNTTRKDYVWSATQALPVWYRAMVIAVEKEPKRSTDAIATQTATLMYDVQCTGVVWCGVVR